MATLGVSLGTVGISQATGYQLVAQREQLNVTLPRGDRVAKEADKVASSDTVATTSSDSSSSTVKTSNTSNTSNKGTPAPGPKQLTPEQQRAVQELQQIDRTVRAHEQAHLSAGRGVITSAANFTYTYGPDGKQYAVAGEVGIDTSPENKPQANIDKGQLIQAAALAPRDPSPQDYRVASIGSQLEAQGRTDLMRQKASQAESASNANTETNRQQLTRAYAVGSNAGSVVDSDNTPISAKLSVFA